MQWASGQQVDNFEHEAGGKEVLIMNHSSVTDCFHGHKQVN